MAHRDELEAAQQRIQQLEGRIDELEGKKPQVDARAKLASGGSPSQAFGCAFGGLSGLVVLIVAITVGGTHACVACNADVSDPALEALRRCPTAREILGDDIGWSAVGCTNYRSKSGGDPINQGCHSSQSFQIPVSGSKGRGSYRFSASQSAGQNNRFTGGTLYVAGRSVSLSSDGTCTASSN